MHSKRLSTVENYNRRPQTVLNPIAELWVADTIRKRYGDQRVRRVNVAEYTLPDLMRYKQFLAAKTIDKYSSEQDQSIHNDIDEQADTQGGNPLVYATANEVSLVPVQGPEIPLPADTSEEMTVIVAAPELLKNAKDGVGTGKLQQLRSYFESLGKLNKLSIPGTPRQRIGFGAAALLAFTTGLGAGQGMKENTPNPAFAVESEQLSAPPTPYQLQSVHDQYPYAASPELIDTTLSEEQKAVFIEEAVAILKAHEDNSRIDLEGGDSVEVEYDKSKGEHTQASVDYNAATRELTVHSHVMVGRSGEAVDQITSPGVFNTVRIVLRLEEGNMLDTLTDKLTLQTARRAVEDDKTGKEIVEVFGQYPDASGEDGINKSYAFYLAASSSNPGEFQVGTWDKAYQTRLINFEEAASVARATQLSALAAEAILKYQ